MRSSSVLTIFALSTTIFASPTPDSATSLNSAQAMAQRFAEIPDCIMTPGQNCAGAARADVIVQYSKDQTQASKDLFLNAAKAAGAQVHEVMNNFGFTAFIPDSVVDLMKAYGDTIGVKIHDNACSGIPWCGEAPC